MTQHGLDYYMNEKENEGIKVNSKIENITEENNKLKINTEIETDDISELDGIVEVKYGNEIYRTWTVKLIRPLLIKNLKILYPDSLIIRGIIDMIIFDRKSDKIIQIEIQKSPILQKYFHHSAFEDDIRRQININIETYGECWSFFDSEYFRFLQSGNVGKSTSVDLTWIVKLMKEGTLKVFIIKYNGEVRELVTKDFDFLKNLSQICPLGEDSSERLLAKNKLKIEKRVLFGYELTQEEITQFENEFDNRTDRKYKNSEKYFRNSDNERCRLYGNILWTIDSLLTIDTILSCNVGNKENRERTQYGIILGLFEQNELNGNNRHATIKFIDKFNIAQYFPGYIKNKQMWDYCKKKQRVFTASEFRGIIDRTFNYDFIRKQSTMENF